MGIQQNLEVWVGVSDGANQLARELIIDLQIQPGSGLAFFLNVNAMFDNYVALRIWVQHMINLDAVDQFNQLEELKKLLIELLPSS